MAEKTNGMPTGLKTVIMWSLGLGVLALIFIVLLILFGNLSGNLGFDRDSTVYTNESGYAINDTTYVLTNGVSTPEFVSLSVGAVYNDTFNGTGPQILLLDGNYTVDPIAGTITGVVGRSFNYSDVRVTYTVLSKATVETNTDSVIGNYSESATNTSGQFPVIGTIIGIALLLIVLIGVLIFAIRKLMGITSSSGNGGNNLRGSSSFG